MSSSTYFCSVIYRHFLSRRDVFGNRTSNGSKFVNQADVRESPFNHNRETPETSCMYRVLKPLLRLSDGALLQES